MASSADLVIAIRAMDQATATLNNVAGSLNKVGQTAQQHGPSFLGMSAAVATGTAAYHALAGAVTLGAGVVGGAITKFGQMEAQLNIFQATTNATGAQMQAVSAKARALGADIELPATSSAGAATAMTELAKAGLNVDQVMDAAKGTLQLAAAAGIGEAQAAALAAGALNAFGLEGSQASRVAQQLAYAANASSLNAAELGQSVAQAGFAFKATGRPMEELLGSMIVLGNAGLSGSDGATALKNAVIRAIDPTKEAKKVMAEYGISLFDAQGKMKPIPNIIDTLNTALGPLDDQTRNSALATIFLSDGMKAIIPLMQAGGDKVRGYVDELKTTDAATAQAQARSAGFEGALKGLNSQWDTLQETVGSMVVPALTNGVRFIAQFAGEVADAVQKGDFAPIGEAARTAMKTTSDAFYSGGQAVSDWSTTSGSKIPVIGPLVKTMGSTIGDAMIAVAAAFRGDAAGAMEAFKNAMNGLPNVASAAGNAIKIAFTPETMNSIGRSLANIASAGDGLASALDKLTSSADSAGSRFNILGAALRIAATPLELISIRVETAAKVIGGLVGVVQHTVASMQAFGEAIGHLASGNIPAMNEAIDRQREHFRLAQDGMNDLSNVIEAGAAKAEHAFNRAFVEASGDASTAASQNMGRLRDDWNRDTGEMESALALIPRSTEAMAAAVEIDMQSVADITQASFDAAVTAAADGSATIADEAGAGAQLAAAAYDDGMSQIAGVTATNFDAAVGSAAEGGADIAAETGSAGATAASDFDAKIAAMESAAANAASAAVSAVAGQVGPAGAAGASVGASMAAGMAGAITARTAEVVNAAAGMVRAGLNAARATAESQSPSKATMKIGEDFVEGFLIAIREGQMGEEVRLQVEDMIAAFDDYRIVSGEIARVESEIKDIREEAAHAALERAQDMIDLTSEELRLRKDLAIAEADLLPARKELRDIQRDMRDAEKGALPQQERVIEINAEINKLKLAELQLDRQMIGVDRRSKEAEAVIKAKEEIDKNIKTLELERKEIELGGKIAADAYKKRELSIKTVIDSSQKEIDAIKDVIDMIDAQQKIFQSEENIIKNATQNEINMRQRLIQVFKDEAKPVADRIAAGRRLIDTMRDEGTITKEAYDEIIKYIDKQEKNVGATGKATTAAGTFADKMKGSVKPAVEGVTGALNDLEGKDPTVTVTTNVTDALHDIATVEGRVGIVEALTPIIEVGADISGWVAGSSWSIDKANVVNGLTPVINVGANTGAASAAISILEGEANQLKHPIAMAFSANVPSTVKVDGLNVSNAQLDGIGTLRTGDAELGDVESGEFRSDDFRADDFRADDAKYDDAKYDDAKIETAEAETQEMSVDEMQVDSFEADGNARGGGVRAGRASIVGEEGPELVFWGSNGTVIPHGQSMAMLGSASGGSMGGGGGVTVVVNVGGSVMAEHDLAMTIRDELIRVGRTNRNIFGGYA